MNDIVPIKLYEYMSMRKPVISRYLTGVYREFGDSNGVLYIEDSKDVVDKSLELWNKNMVDKHGEKARNFVLRNCDWNALVKKFIEAIENICP